jgi:hypothetical protein
VKALVQVIFSIGKTALSSVAGLFDRYLDLFRTIAESDEEQMVRRILFNNCRHVISCLCAQALMESIVEVVGQESGMLVSSLDLLLRRSILSPSAVSGWLVQPAQLAKIGSIQNSSTSEDDADANGSGNTSNGVNGASLFAVAETLTDRAMDLVNATVAYRRSLINPRPAPTPGAGFNFTSTAGSTPAIAEAPAASSIESATTAKTADAEEEDEVTIGSRKRAGSHHDDNDGDDNESGRRGRTTAGDTKRGHHDDEHPAVDYDEDDEPEDGNKRRRRSANDDVTSVAKAVDDSADADGDDDVITTANETVESSVTTAHAVYLQLLRAVLAHIRDDVQFQSIQQLLLANASAATATADATISDARYGWELGCVGIAVRLARSFHAVERQLNEASPNGVIRFCDVEAVEEQIAQAGAGNGDSLLGQYLISSWRSIVRP